jgi:hypothetical protein
LGFWVGCDFRLSGKDALSHLLDHDLLQRSEGYETIVALRGYSPSYGACTCPICYVQVTSGFISTNSIWTSDGAFMGHVALHSKTDRALHATVLSKMLRPYLIGKETFSSSDNEFIFHKLRAELEEVEAI